jgi:hypothetical protein
MTAPVLSTVVDADPRLAPYRAEVERTRQKADAAWSAWSASCASWVLSGEPDHGEPDPPYYADAQRAQDEHDQALARYYEEESALYPTIIT